jgi:hypothetical protein
MLGQFLHKSVGGPKVSRFKSFREATVYESEVVTCLSTLLRARGHLTIDDELVVEIDAFMTGRGGSDRSEATTTWRVPRLS